MADAVIDNSKVVNFAGFDVKTKGKFKPDGATWTNFQSHPIQKCHDPNPES